MHHRRTKHIDVRYHHIRHHIEDGVIKVAYISTKEQLADPLTRSVDSNTLRMLTTAIFTELLTEE